MKRREGERAEQKGSFSTAAGLTVLKALREVPNGTHPLTALTRAVKMKLGPCQEIVDALGKEGLVEVELDTATGNDVIRLSDKREELLR